MMDKDNAEQTEEEIEHTNNSFALGKAINDLCFEHIKSKKVDHVGVLFALLANIKNALASIALCYQQEEKLFDLYRIEVIKELTSWEFSEIKESMELDKENG